MEAWKAHTHTCSIMVFLPAGTNIDPAHKRIYLRMKKTYIYTMMHLQCNFRLGVMPSSLRLSSPAFLLHPSILFLASISSEKKCLKR